MEDPEGRRLFEALGAGPAPAERASLADRPRHHFLPAVPSWMNDPVPFYADGLHHVFFQYHPGRPYHGRIHWGHAVSRDLVRWDERPVALAPGPGSADAGGCWTGCVVDTAAAPGAHIASGLRRYVALYTGVTADGRQSQCLADSDDLDIWRKRPDPVIAADGRPEGGETFRDPHVWHEAGEWHMVLGGCAPAGPTPDGGGRPMLYRSRDLVEWEYLHVLCEGPHVCDECPDLFRLGARHVLLSSRDHTAWVTGHLRGRRLATGAGGVLDPGALYAVKTLADGSGRRLAFGWIREERGVDAQVAAGWSGVQSLPRVLTLDHAGRLRAEPPTELERLRGTSWHATGTPRWTAEADGRFEAVVRAEAGCARAWGLRLFDRVSLEADPRAPAFAGVPVPPEAADRPLEVRLFVDRSVVEVFVGGWGTATLRTYGARPDALEVWGTAADVTVWALRDDLE